jgi:tetratricopeptide (TPR) repeat protein
VLLKNDNRQLPLRKDLKSIAVIGPNADSLEVLLGNYHGVPSKWTTPLEGIRRKVSPATRVLYALGTTLTGEALLPVPANALSHDGGKPGLFAEYFDNKDLQGKPAATRVDEQINFDWFTNAPVAQLPLDNFSAQIVALENTLSKIENKEIEQRRQWDLSALYFSRANLYLNKLETEKMKADLIKAVEWHPIPISYERRAGFYAKQKMYEDALADLNKAIEMNSDKDAGLFMRRGDVYYAMQKYSKAIKEYEQVLKQKAGLEPLAERRISQAKQKIQESGGQLK